MVNILQKGFNHVGLREYFLNAFVRYVCVSSANLHRPSSRQKIKEHSHTFAYIFHSSKPDLLVNGHFEQLVPLEDQNKYAWSVKQDEKQIIGFFRKLAKPNDTLDRYLSLSNLDQNADYIINQKNKVSGRVLTNFGLREPYKFNASNGDTAQVTGDFQSYLFEIEKE